MQAMKPKQDNNGPKETFQIQVDGVTLKVAKGASLLKACLDHGIYIPNLCFLDQASQPFAACRLCFVELDGRADPVTACTTPVENDMIVKTDTQVVRRLQKTALELILSVHDVDCKNCHANKNCQICNEQYRLPEMPTDQITGIRLYWPLKCG